MLASCWDLSCFSPEVIFTSDTFCVMYSPNCMAYYGLMYKSFSHSLLNVKQQIILVIKMSLVLYKILHVYYETLMMQPVMTLTKDIKLLTAIKSLRNVL